MTVEQYVQCLIPEQRGDFLISSDDLLKKGLITEPEYKARLLAMYNLSLEVVKQNSHDKNIH